MGSKILKFDHIKRPGNHIPQVGILIEFWSASCERIGVSNKNVVMWVKQCHKPPMFFFYPFMVIWGMVYFCFTHITHVIKPTYDGDMMGYQQSMDVSNMEKGSILLTS